MMTFYIHETLIGGHTYPARIDSDLTVLHFLTMDDSPLLKVGDVIELQKSGQSSVIKLVATNTPSTRKSVVKEQRMKYQTEVRVADFRG